jgi:hypothetical protein
MIGMSGRQSRNCWLAPFSPLVVWSIPSPLPLRLTNYFDRPLGLYKQLQFSGIMIPFITVEVGDPLLSDDNDLNLDTGSKEVKYHANRTWKDVWSKSAEQMIVEPTMQVVSWNQMLHDPAWINKYGIVLLPNSKVSKISAIHLAKRGNMTHCCCRGTCSQELYHQVFTSYA